MQLFEPSGKSDVELAMSKGPNVPLAFENGMLC